MVSTPYAVRPVEIEDKTPSPHIVNQLGHVDTVANLLDRTQSHDCGACLHVRMFYGKSPQFLVNRRTIPDGCECQKDLASRHVLRDSETAHTSCALFPVDPATRLDRLKISTTGIEHPIERLANLGKEPGERSGPVIYRGVIGLDDHS